MTREQAARTGRAYFSNCFFVEAGDAFRIAFLEEWKLIEMLPEFVSAVTITRGNAIQLHKLLGELIEKTEVKS